MSEKDLRNVKYLMRFLPDKLYIQAYYFARFKKFCNLKNPRTFNEKINWLKLHDHNPMYPTMVDKCEAKKYVANIIGEQHIIPTLGVWNSFDEIDFDTLPNQFVLKCTHDCGGYVIIRDKAKMNKAAVKKKLEAALSQNFYYIAREWQYKNLKSRIIAEAYMDDSDNADSLNKGRSLMNYKFFCFNGNPLFSYVANLNDVRISFLNLDWSFAEFQRSDYRQFDELPPKPSCLDEMIEIARKLSEGLPFVRVDLYEVNHTVYFSELTLTPGGGFIPFEPKEWDEKLGELLDLGSVKSYV